MNLRRLRPTEAQVLSGVLELLECDARCKQVRRVNVGPIQDRATWRAVVALLTALNNGAAVSALRGLAAKIPPRPAVYWSITGVDRKPAVGHSDIIFTILGVCCFFECKKIGENPTTEQAAFGAQAQRDGCYWAVVDDVAHAYYLIDTWHREIRARRAA